MELTEKYFMEMAGWKAMKAARALVESRKVLSATWKPPILKGTVEAGGRTFSSGFSFKNPKDIENLCRCRESQEWGTLCHHSVAVALESIRKEKFRRGELKPEKRAVSPAPVSSDSSGRNKNTPRVNLLKRSLDPGYGDLLEIKVILAPNWLERVEGGSGVSLAFRAILNGQDESAQALGSIDTSKTWFMEDHDLRLIDSLEEMRIDKLPSHLSVNSGQFFEIVAALANHPGISAGEKEVVKVSENPWIPPCRLSANKDGSLSLSLESSSATGKDASAPRILMGPPAWVFIDQSLHPVSPAASQWDWNKNEHVITRGKMDQFVQNQWDHLAATEQVTFDFETDQFSVSAGSPTFHLSLTGGLANLKARLQCRYGREFHTLKKSDLKRKPATSSGSDRWIVDPDNPFDYWTRDLECEARALNMLLQAGFDEIEEGEFQCRSQEVVLPFFATVFPRLQKQNWDIEMEPRLDTSLNTKTERIEPQLEFMRSGEDWFEMQVEYSSSRGSRFSEGEVRDLLRSGKPFSKKPDGKILLIDAPLLDEFQDVVRDCSPEQENRGYKFESRQAHFLLDSVSEATNWKTRGGEKLLTKPASDALKIPSELKSVLRDYQKTGTEWISGLYQNHLGGILADDMGLGKTLQTLAFVMMTREQAEGSCRPSLIVCPTSLVHNWEAEVDKWVPNLKSLVLHGQKRHKRFSEIDQCDIVITSLPLIHRDIESLTSINFRSVFVDEAQNIKNPTSKSARAVRKLRADFRLALSGTPVENRIMDLWALLDFVMPGYLGNQKEFQTRYEIPIAKQKDSQVAARLRRRINPFILRRLKSEVAKELPDKIDQVHFCEMTPEQAHLYQSALNESRSKIEESVEKSGFARNRFLIFKTLMKLRQICCDMRLLGDDQRLEASQTGKFELYREVLDEAIDGGHKVLVFSQFTSMLELLCQSATEKGIDFSLLTGSTRNRKQVIEEFRQNSGKKVFFISLKAGGTGLNLTEADVVIHYDPWWNPAIEDQATSRAHRIGQTRIVSSYKLITKGSIEEKILKLQEKKRNLFKTMIDENTELADSLSWDEVQELLDDSDF